MEIKEFRSHVSKDRIMGPLKRIRTLVCARIMGKMIWKNEDCDWGTDLEIFFRSAFKGAMFLNNRQDILLVLKT